jgi:predicted MFS family arabinose efflux permease
VEIKSSPGNDSGAAKLKGLDGSLGIFSRTEVGVALVAVIALNLLNHIDRNLLAGAQPVIQKALQASDSRMGAVSSRFFIAYMLAAPLLGWLGDRFPRRVLVPACVVWWSCALGIATLGRDFGLFPLAYTMVAIAEAAFGVYAVVLISDYYPHANRSKALSLFILAMTCGRALGFPLGGWLAQTFGWRFPFRLMALVGLLLGLLAVRFLFEPKERRVAPAEASASGKDRRLPFRALLSKGYLLAVLGLAMENFALGGLSVWLPTYLHRFAGYSVAHAASVLGVIALACGTGGTWLGGVMGEKLLRRDHRALYWISAVSFALAIPCVVAILAESRGLILGGVLGVQLFLFMNMGPLNAAILNSVPASVRSTAIATSLFLIHALGDAISPHLIGLISDARGLRAGLATTIAALVAGVVLLVIGAQGAPRKTV